MTSDVHDTNERQRRRGARGVLRVAGEVERADLGANVAAFSLPGEDTGGLYSLTTFTMAPPPLPGPPPHVHEDASEAVYILDGEVELGIEERRLVGTAGSVMFVPKGTLHSVANVGAQPATLLVILSPPGYEGFWREMAIRRASGPVDDETVLALQRKYHLVTGGEPRRLS